MKRFSLLLAGLLVGILTVTQAIAEDGVISASSLHQLPTGKSIWVLALDDSDENLRLKTEIEKQLAANGYTISKGASLVLRFETRDQIGGWDSGTKGHVFSFEANGGRGGGEDSKAMLNVYDSSTGGLLNRNQGERGASSTASQFRIDATIEASNSGKTYWQAWSVAELGYGNREGLVKKMVEPLIDGIGQTIRSQAFSLK